MKITLLAALLAVVGLTACEKTTVNPPATTVVTPTVETPAPAAVAVPVPVPGPQGEPGAPGTPGEPGTPGAPGEPGKDGSTTVIVPEGTTR
ncbi:MAG: collagen-like protein [Telluria sp.]